MTDGFERDIVVVGGCGRVGLPLGLAFADRGLRVVLFDTNEAAAETVNAATMPFDEPGAPPVLARVLGAGLTATTDPASVSSAEHVVVVVGTPVDEHLNPEPAAVPDAISALAPYLVDGQHLVLRSTLYPGVTAMVERLIEQLGKRIDVSFCPERIAEGKALTELYELPQIVSGRTDRAAERAAKLFGSLTSEIVTLAPEEAELAKLFTNTWRYIRFATANQLYMIANDFGLDYERIRAAMAFNYPRAADLPSAGFTAGPCLFKDTMQLAAFNNNNFMLGHASMMVNEGLPLYVVAKAEATHDLSQMTVGILGMAFKAESDDPRSSLSYKLRRILRFKARHVLCADPYVADDSLVPVDEVVDRADLIFVGAPHAAFGLLELRQPVIDIWGLFGDGVRV
jgi:UDP-N-acetyl-D-mannosaminuronic acid dehydrogenase